jgi:hypothetical protein
MPDRDWYMAGSRVDRTPHSPPRSWGSCLVALIKGHGRTLPQSCDAAFLHRISRRFDLEAIYRWKHTRNPEYFPLHLHHIRKSRRDGGRASQTIKMMSVATCAATILDKWLRIQRSHVTVDQPHGHAPYGTEELATADR